MNVKEPESSSDEFLSISGKFKRPRFSKTPEFRVSLKQPQFP